MELDLTRGSVLRHHRTIVSACLAGSFPPILRFEKREIHKVFLRFPNLDLTKNPTPSHLAKLCGDAIMQFVVQLILNAKSEMLIFSFWGNFILPQTSHELHNFARWTAAKGAGFLTAESNPASRKEAGHRPQGTAYPRHSWPEYGISPAYSFDDRTRRAPDGARRRAVRAIILRRPSSVLQSGADR